MHCYPLVTIKESGLITKSPLFDYLAEVTERILNTTKMVKISYSIDSKGTLVEVVLKNNCDLDDIRSKIIGVNIMNGHSIDDKIIKELKNELEYYRLNENKQFILLHKK